MLADKLGDERLQERERRVAAAARRADGLLDDVEAALQHSRSGMILRRTARSSCTATTVTKNSRFRLC